MGNAVIAKLLILPIVSLSLEDTLDQRPVSMATYKAKKYA
jgi:hypothetical protein